MKNCRLPDQRKKKERGCCNSPPLQYLVLLLVASCARTAELWWTGFMQIDNFSLICMMLLLLLHLLLVTAASSSQQCRRDCGGISIKYPFGVDEGCGSYEFRNTLDCIMQLQTSSSNTSTSTGGLRWRNVLSFKAQSGIYEVQAIDYSNKSISLWDPYMTTCSDSSVTAGRNFSLQGTASTTGSSSSISSVGLFHLQLGSGGGSSNSASSNTDVLLLNCNNTLNSAANQTLHSNSTEEQFWCNDSAPVCTAFKRCTEYHVSNTTTTSSPITTCCALTDDQRYTTSIDLSLLRYVKIIV